MAGPQRRASQPDGHRRTHVLDAVSVLERGGLVAFPTETVYGLGADASSPAAVARIFAAKARPTDHPLIVHVADVDGLAACASTVAPAAHRLVETLWPGPLTVIVGRGDRVCAEAAGGLATVGVRCPAHPLALELLAAFGRGVAAPSANRFGCVSPTTAADVIADLGDAVDLVLDGGACRIGIESTIVDCTAAIPAVLRLGAIGLAELEEALGSEVAMPERPTVRAPGTLGAHYAPSARVVLVEDDTTLDAFADAARGDGPVAVLAPTSTAPVAGTERLDTGSTPAEAARRLYASLREADRRGIRTILALVPPGDDPLSSAVRDRLRRAAAAT